MGKAIDKKKISLIHVARAKVGMTEAEYRDMLAGVGVKSSKELDYPKFEEVMDRFQKLGFKNNFFHRARTRPAAGKRPLMGKIKAILADLGLPWQYADGIAKKRFGKELVQHCDEAQLYKIVQMLSVHQKRVKRKAEGGRLKAEGGRR